MIAAAMCGGALGANIGEERGLFQHVLREQLAHALGVERWPARSISNSITPSE